MILLRACAFVLLVALASPLFALKIPRPFVYNRATRNLAGTVVDYTHNNRHDNRIWSESLCEKRDLYVYLPPGYDKNKSYPLFIWMHGFTQDENTFLDYVVKRFDCAISQGVIPPMIVIAPDGSIGKNWKIVPPGSFFINSKAGKFEDYLMKDVLGFVTQNYLVSPHRRDHALGGTSMGGAAAYHLGMKHQQFFKNIAGIYPPLNIRYQDKHGRFMGNYDPMFRELRDDFSRGSMTVGRFFGIIYIKVDHVLGELFDYRSPDVIKEIAAMNPIEMIDYYKVDKADLSFFLAYGGKDQFNLDAQAESFLDRAREKNLDITVRYDPKGRHDTPTAIRFLPELLEWLGGQMSGKAEEK